MVHLKISLLYIGRSCSNFHQWLIARQRMLVGETIRNRYLAVLALALTVCRGWESNPHEELPRTILSRERLPVPSPRQELLPLSFQDLFREFPS